MGPSLAILHLNENAKVMAYHRWDQGGPHDDVIVVFNFANTVWKHYLICTSHATASGKSVSTAAGKATVLTFKTTKIDEVNAQNGTGSLDLAPYAVLILSQDD